LHNACIMGWGEMINKGLLKTNDVGVAGGLF
jgi:hypothetical protein